MRTYDISEGRGRTKYDLAAQVMEDIEQFREVNGCSGGALFGKRKNVSSHFLSASSRELDAFIHELNTFIFQTEQQNKTLEYNMVDGK